MATTLTAAEQFCVVVQAYLDTQNTPDNSALNLGMHKLLKSASNKDGFNAKTKSGAGMPLTGQNAKIEIKYVKPVCGDTDDITTLCDETTTAVTNPFGNATHQFPTTSVSSKAYKVPESIYKQVCDTKEAIDAAIIDQHFKNILTKAENKLIQSAFDCMGIYCSGDDSTDPAQMLTVNLFSEDGKFAQPAAMETVAAQLRNAKANGKASIIGGSRLKSFLSAMANAGLGANALGAAPTILQDYNFYYSSEFDSAMATAAGTAGDYMLVIAPGTVQILDYLDNVGPFHKIADSYIHTTLSRTFDGIEFQADFDGAYNAKCKEWEFLLRTMEDTWCLPTNDYCEGTAPGRWAFKIGCGTPDLCASPCVSPGATLPPQAKKAATKKAEAAQE